MLTLDLKAAQGQFFDRAKVLAAMDRATARSLSKAGAFVRRSARSSIRPPRRLTIADLDADRRVAYEARVVAAAKAGRPKPRLPFASSKPGEPPRTPTGVLRKSVQFVYDRGSKSVVIGPVALNRGTEAPRTLEYGGPAVVVRRVDGQRQSQTVRIEPRPFMRPALVANLAVIPEQFRDSIRGSG